METPTPQAIDDDRPPWVDPVRALEDEIAELEYALKAARADLEKALEERRQ
jgi:hypothetical protein